MSGFAPIDLSRLPPPDVVETLDYGAIKQAMIADFLSLCREAGIEPSALESDPAMKVLEVAAYRELLLRQRVNEAAKAVMLAHARAGDLDHLAALLGVARLSGEGDERLRDRVRLAPDGYSVAGPIGAYQYHALAADAGVRDVAVTSPEPGQVVLTVLGSDGDGTPSAALLARVLAAVNADDVRPLTDLVSVQAASIRPYAVQARLWLYQGPDEAVVVEAARAATTAYVSARHKLGHDIAVSGLHAALHQPGVQRVELDEPVTTLVIDRDAAAWCTGITITVMGRDE